MSLPSQSTVTESDLLTTFLLAPSPLPTIIPYSSFLTLVPQTYRSNADYSPYLKRLYRDLQFQRSITIDQVRLSIERECGSRATSLRARLLRRIAIEQGDELAERDELRNVLERRKRKRDNTFLVHQNDNMNVNDCSDDDITKREDEFTDPRELTAQRTFHDHESMLHPAAHVLPFEEGSNARMNGTGASQSYHTENSLLQSMEMASLSLEGEIAELEAECQKSEMWIEETVEGLSDLKYGKSKASKDQDVNTGGEDTTFAKVLSALGDFQELLKSKTSTSALTVP